MSWYRREPVPSLLLFAGSTAFVLALIGGLAALGLGGAP